MTEYMVWIWLIVLIVMLVLEFMTADFLTVWFAISAVPTVVIAAIWPQLVWIQVLFFLPIWILTDDNRQKVCNKIYKEKYS